MFSIISLFFEIVNDSHVKPSSQLNYISFVGSFFFAITMSAP